MKTRITIIVSSEETEPVFILDVVPVVNLKEKTFSKLRAAFPGPLLEDNLKTLQTLANSDIYLEFLSRVSKQVKPFQTFDEFLDTVPPDAEKKIRPIFRQYLAHLVINDQDIASFHKLATIIQTTVLLINLNLHLSLIPPHMIKAEARAVESAPLWRWFPSFPPEAQIETHVRSAFWDVLATFAEDANETARKEIQNTLHEHGQDEGLIWLAIQEPRILGVILNTFINPLIPADFLRWIAPEEQEN